jgi:D-amino-acid dehydrogenase
MKVVVIGAGVIGLCSAYYLSKAGHEVTIIEKGNLNDGCSYGNMGYVSPSHFIPLATPGIISQGLKWMMSASSPFYIKPRLDLSLMKWGFHFWKSTTAKQVSYSAIHLNNLLQLSRSLTKEMVQELPGSSEFQEKGVWMLYKNEDTEHHEIALAKDAEAFGLKTVICDQAGVQAYEKEVEVNVRGGVLYTDDCHLNPTKFMNSLVQYLKDNKVTFLTNTEITNIEVSNQSAKNIITKEGSVKCDELVVANGSWMEHIANMVGTSLLMQPGKGYSMEYHDIKHNLSTPSILVDDRVATTPIGSWLRIGGTMELSGHSNNILPKRVLSIYDAFKKYYPDMTLAQPDPSKAWFGYRPVTPDGMPYIGKTKKLKNVAFAGGHAMLGISGAASTGKLIAEVVGNEKTTIPLEAFRVDRF